MADEVVDIIKVQDEMKAHMREFVLWPLRWQQYTPGNHAWHLQRLRPDDVNNIPESAGVYTLLIQPGIASHPSCSYVMYVGRSDSLRRRFREYLGPERRATGRPKIYRLLHRYSDYLWFCFTEVEAARTKDVEDALMTAYVPPENDQLPAEIRNIRGAF